METVKGYVEHIVFRNEDNGYTVFNLNNDDGDLTCVGNFNYLSEGELVEVNGEYVYMEHSSECSIMRSKHRKT